MHVSFLVAVYATYMVIANAVVSAARDSVLRSSRLRGNQRESLRVQNTQLSVEGGSPFALCDNTRASDGFSVERVTLDPNPLIKQVPALHLIVSALM